MRPGPVAHHDAWLSCRDGVRLISRIWTPPGAGPWPVLLMRQPYGLAIASTVTYAHPSWYAARGFLVVVQDVRGRGDSEGEFGGFVQEARDGTDTLQWVRQLPGSNGRVGCYGFSYQGLSQLLLEPDGPLPDCLAPAMAGLDERLHWGTTGGAHWWALGLGWGLQLAAERCRRQGEGDGWQTIREALESGRFLHEGLALLERHDPDGMALRWLRQDPGSPRGWIRHSPPEALWRQPMLLIGGWHDPHLEGVLDLWRLARQHGGSPMLRIGAWSHLHWQDGLDALQLAFFRRHLQGVEPEVSGRGAIRDSLDWPIAVQDSRSGVWYGSVWCGSELDREPPPGPEDQGSRTLAWQLAPDPPESAPAGPGHSWVCVVHDPWRPVPGRGGHLGLDAGLCDRTDLDARRDVTCFSSAPLSAPCRLSGRPLLDVELLADQDGFDLCVALSVVEAPEGRVRQLSTGFLRQRGGHCRHPGRHRIALQPLRTTLQPGERLRLSLAGAAWPQVAVNPGTDELPPGPSSAGHRVITITVNTAACKLAIEPFAWEKAGAN